MSAIRKLIEAVRDESVHDDPDLYAYGLANSASAELEELYEIINQRDHQLNELQRELKELEALSAEVNLQLAERDRADAELREAFAEFLRQGVFPAGTGVLVYELRRWAAKGGK